MEPKQFIEKNIYNFIPILEGKQDTMNNIILSYSESKNIFFIIINGILFYIGEFDHNKKDFILKKIKINQIDYNTRIKRLCLTKNHIYILNKEKLIFYSNYNNFIFSQMKGPIQKKKIMSLVCSDNDILLLTYAGLVYHINEQNKENQKLLNELLDYNISSISAGSNHFLALGSIRNNDYNKDENLSLQDKDCMLFSWGDNTYFQCGVNNKKYINYPTLISNSIGIRQISSGNNHNIILLNNGNIIFFGDNKYNQCFYDNKNIVQLPRKEDIAKFSLCNEFLKLKDEYIQKIKAKENSSLLISDKGTLIFNGKIFNNKQKIFILENNINFRPWSCFSDDFFLVLKNGINNNIFKEIKYDKNSFITKKKIIVHYSHNNLNNYNNNEEYYFQKKISHKIPTKKNSFTLSFECLKNEKKNDLINSNKENNESLNKLKSYINILGISLTSTYDDSHISYRPSNLPPKSKEEQKLHRELVYKNRLKYINLLKRKQELEKLHILYLEKEKEKKEKLKKYWLNKIIPNWALYKGNYKEIEKYFYDGIPNTLRGKIWILCIGNKFCITKDFYDIGFKKSIQLIMKFYSKDKKNEIYKEEDFNKLLNNNIEITESSENFSKDYLILSEKTKKNIHNIYQKL